MVRAGAAALATGLAPRFNQSGALAAVIARKAEGVAVAARACDRAAGRTVPPTAGQQCAGRIPRARRAAERGFGRPIVLIDDVLTSGAMVDACAPALLHAKAAQVDLLVFAWVVDSPKTPI